jgi:hypothetical protein
MAAVSAAMRAYDQALSTIGGGEVVTGDVS